MDGNYHYHYGIFEESRLSPEMNTYITYGIKVTPRGDRSVCCDSVADVSLSKPELSAFVGLCNELRLSPIHLRDVVEDFLAR